jgi:thiol-disulfide isomerase/thioredoxin
MDRGGSDEDEDANESRDRVDDERETAAAEVRRPVREEDVYVRRTLRPLTDEEEPVDVWRLWCGACRWAMPKTR